MKELSRKIIKDPVPPIPPEYTQPLTELLNKLLQKVNTKRPTCDQLLDYKPIKYEHEEILPPEP